MQKKRRLPIEEFALAVTRWIGSPQSIVLHTIIFAGVIALLVWGIFPFDVIILVFNTAVSLEAIYLALFIQMTVNFTSESLEGVEEDIDEIQEDIDEIQEDVDEIQEDVDELQEDLEELSEEDTKEEERKASQKRTLEEIRMGLERLMADVEQLQKRS